MAAGIERQSSTILSQIKRNSGGMDAFSKEVWLETSSWRLIQITNGGRYTQAA